jgi:hypothetical protein
MADITDAILDFFASGLAPAPATPDLKLLILRVLDRVDDEVREQVARAKAQPPSAN